MKSAKPHPREAARLAALTEYEILDTLPEQEFDDLTFLASTICETPIALFSLVDESRQWFKSKVGLDAEETHRDLAFCAHAIHEQEVFYIEDATKDERFADNPLVTQSPDIRFYAGTQILSHDGLPLGTLCVIDREPRQLSHDQRKALKALGRQVMSQLELRLHVKKELAVKRKLATANKRLKSLARIKTEFLNHVSHEIRTPLNGILGLSTLLTEQYPVTDKSTERDLETQLNMIRIAASNLYEMVNHVLDISRLESGKMKRIDEPVDLKLLVDELVKMNYSRSREKNINLESLVEIDEEVVLDRTKLLQILVNLLGNAIKFSPSDSTVTVKVARQQGKLKFEVCDRGKGIPKHDLKNIFKPFQQSDFHQDNSSPSSGLGLAIVKELVDFLGGAIEVESELDNGTRFIVTLLYKPIDNVDGKVAKNDIPPELTHKKILLVEDNPVNQLVFRGFLKPTNARLIVVSVAEESVAIIKREKPDLVFLDIRMPGKNGFEIMNDIKQDDEINRIPVAFLSGDVTQENVEKANEFNVEFLAKPILKPVLYQFLERVFSA